GLDVVRGGVAVDTRRPGIPVAVHLVGEAQVERAVETRGRPRPAADVAIVLAGGDLAQAVFRLVDAVLGVPWFPGDHRDRAVLVHPADLVGAEGGVVRAAPGLIPGHDVDLAAQRGLKAGQR